MSENEEVPQSITVIRDERGIAFLGEPASIKQWLDERGMTSREFKVKAAKVASSAIQATNKSAMIEARDDRLRKVQNRVGDLQSVFEQTADRVRGEKLLHPFTVDKVLSQLNDLTSQTYAFSKHLDIEIERKPIERAPEWGGGCREVRRRRCQRSRRRRSAAWRGHCRRCRSAGRCCW